MEHFISSVSAYIYNIHVKLLNVDLEYKIKKNISKYRQFKPVHYITVLHFLQMQFYTPFNLSCPNKC